MARKRPDADELPKAGRDLESAPLAHEPEIIPDGDYAGLSTDLVLRALTDGIHDLFAGRDVDLATAGASIDLALGEYLAMVEGSLGPHNAKVAALAFCETALPYATLDVPVVTTYAEARKIRGHRK